LALLQYLEAKMYHTHSYTADGENHLHLPQYMYNGTDVPNACAWYDLVCKYNKREEQKKASQIPVLESSSIQNKTLLLGMGAGMLLVFGLGAHFLFKK
jgi:hypothetical protein